MGPIENIIRAAAVPWQGVGCVELYAYSFRPPRNEFGTHATEHRQLKFVDNGERPSPGMRGEPAITLNEGEAQMLMDSLFDAGVRPSQAAGSVGQLGAVQKHLED